MLSGFASTSRWSFWIHRGILWPKFDDQQVGLRLAMLGSVNDEILNLEELACELGEFLEKNFPKAMEERYHIVPEEGRRKEEILHWWQRNVDVWQKAVRQILPEQQDFCWMFSEWSSGTDHTGIPGAGKRGAAWGVRKVRPESYRKC